METLRGRYAILRAVHEGVAEGWMQGPAAPSTLSIFFVSAMSPGSRYGFGRVLSLGGGFPGVELCGLALVRASRLSRWL